ncbi:MAG TPA: PilZ domain-containing protein, partial [Nitrospiraceae bacterium]|nr:PilZ domain-containing protein [Nitrospiraceae bacterium]
PAFLTELMIITREILEKRELRARLDLTHERYLRLIETMTDMVYELDTEGRFVHVSPAFATLLGYSPLELIGLHYSKLVHMDAARIAERRFNERRTGVRATRNLELRLVIKTETVKQTNGLEIELAASGLYNRERQFLGTVGVVRDINRYKQEQARIQRLEEQLRQTDRLMELGRSVVKVAHELSSPLTSILDDTQRLLKKVQDLQLENQLEAVASQASRAAQIGKALVAYTQPQQPVRLPVSMNRVIEDILSLASTDLRVHSIQVESQLAQTLPEILGDASQLQQVFLSLITQSRRALQESSQGGRVLVSTRMVDVQEIPSLQASLPAPPHISQVEVAIIIEGQGTADREKKAAGEPSFEWSEASRIIQEHGGVIEADTPPSGTRVRVWLPTIETHPPSHADSLPGTQESQEQPSLLRASPPHEPGPTTLLKKEQVLPHAERRRSSRIDVRTETRLTLEGTTWEGTALNISQGGAYIVFEGMIPVTENQPTRIGLVSEVGVLELPATLRGIREVTEQRIQASAKPALGLAVEFGELGTGERLIFASLLDGLQEGLVSVKLTVLLTPQETGDLLLEVSSSGTDSEQLSTIHPGPPELEDTSPPERRLAARMNFAVPALVEIQDSSSNIQQHRALTVNLSMGGACIRLQALPNLLGRRLLLRLFLPSEILANQPSGASAFSSDCTMTGEVVWITLDTTASAELREGAPAYALRMGLQLLHLNDEGERALEQLVARFLTSPLRSEERSEPTSLVSLLIECRNEMGQRISVYHDHPLEGLPPGAPLVIISPGYGETKKEYIALAYYLAINGFQVLRYDHTNHVGDSEGDIVQTTLTGMKQDLSALLGYAKRTWPTSHIAVVATSLTGLVALKMVTQDSSVELLVLLTPVVNLRATLVAVHQEDHIDAYLRGIRLGVMNVLGFNVNADRFLNDAVKEGYTDLQTTIKDAQRIHTPVIFFAADHDLWVNVEEVKKVQAALSPTTLSHLYLVPEALHSLRENPRKARSVFRQIVTCCLEQFYPFAPKGEMLKPSQREIGLQSRLERERARIQRHMGKAENTEFWRDYLAQFHYIVNSSDYWHLLDHIYSSLGVLERDERILDAGCGNGNFGMFLLINQAYRERNTPSIKAE